MWHYKMEIKDKCKDSKVSVAGELLFSLKYPSNTYYPPGLVCAKECTRNSCFSNWDSGSPLMVQKQENPKRYHIEGVLSFVKGCDSLRFIQQSENDDEWRLIQTNENPMAYTKLLCFLPWVAEQYGLSYKGDRNNPSCRFSNGEKNTTQTCRTKEYNENKCIFPFYSRGKQYEKCALLEPSNFVYPVL